MRLVQLRIILLQDSVIFREQFPLHPIWSDPIFLRDDYEAFATEVEQSMRDLEEPEEVQLRQALTALAERLNHVRQDLQQGLGHAIKEWGSKTHLQLQEINNYLHDIMGGRVAFTLQAVDPDTTKSFMSAVQSPRLIPESISAPSAVTAAAADGSGAVTMQETFESVPTPNHAGGIPHYVPFRTVHTVPELWREWTSGLGGKPSIQSLEDTYGAAWRPLQRERVKFCRRKVIIDEIRKRHATGTPLLKAVEEVELVRQRGKMGLHALSQMLQKKMHKGKTNLSHKRGAKQK